MRIGLDASVASNAIASPGGSPKRIYVANCPVNRISLDEIITDLCARIEQKQRTHVVFINAAKVVRYRNDLRLRGAIERADFLLADGVPIVWASWLYGIALPGRVNGTDLMEKMLLKSAERGYRVYLLGARLKILERCIYEIKQLYPSINIVGYRDGYFSESEEKDVIEAINASQADILFVGMPTPRKEVWADRNLNMLDITVCQGVGGSFDVMARLVKRAPDWMQACGLEWFFRFLQEPRRLWRRYLQTNSMFIWLVVVDVLAKFIGRSLNSMKAP